MINMHKLFKSAFFGGGCLLPLLGQAQPSISITSPDKAFVLKTTVTPSGNLQYSVRYKKTTFLEPSTLGFALSKPKMNLTQFALVSVDSSAVDETWQPVWGEVSSIRNHYKTLTLKDKSCRLRNRNNDRDQ
jgi:hypothetical protein